MKIRINRQLLRTASIPGENVLEHSWLQRQGAALHSTCSEGGNL